jgi:hypothetical protein
MSAGEPEYEIWEAPVDASGDPNGELLRAALQLHMQLESAIGRLRMLIAALAALSIPLAIFAFASGRGRFSSFVLSLWCLVFLGALISVVKAARLRAALVAAASRVGAKRGAGRS